MTDNNFQIFLSNFKNETDKGVLQSVQTCKLKSYRHSGNIVNSIAKNIFLEQTFFNKDIYSLLNKNMKGHRQRLFYLNQNE
jgi:hypothetical protein